MYFKPTVQCQTQTASGQTQNFPQGWETKQSFMRVNVKELCTSGGKKHDSP